MNYNMQTNVCETQQLSENAMLIAKVATVQVWWKTARVVLWHLHPCWPIILFSWVPILVITSTEQYQEFLVTRMNWTVLQYLLGSYFSLQLALQACLRAATYYDDRIGIEDNHREHTVITATAISTLVVLVWLVWSLSRSSSVDNLSLWGLAFSALALSFLSYLVICYRHGLWRWIYDSLIGTQFPDTPTKVAANAPATSHSDDSAIGSSRRLILPAPSVPIGQTLFHSQMLGLVVVFFGAFLFGTPYFIIRFFFDPISVSWRLGAVAVLLNLVTVWLAAIVVLVILARRWSTPIPAVLILLAIGFGWAGWSNNHDIRVIAMEDSIRNGSASKRTALPSALTAWHQQAGEQSPLAARLPVIVVAAAGGGQRAAIWTATVLTQLEAQYPAFREHLFAISAVSGGALGATMFVAANSSPVSPEELKKSLKDMLSYDFLSPLVTRFLSTDILQLFLPFAAFSDRAATLEKAWERSWAEVFKDRPETFSRPFLELWPDGRPWPALFLNGTWVENGQRGIASNISLGKDFDADDVLDKVDREIRVSTAVNMSTRFPYITPVGVVRTRDGKVFGQIADGGYYDNFGATTALEILRGIETIDRTRSAKPEIVPIVVTITSDPEWQATEAKEQEGALAKNGPTPQSVAPIEILDKIRQERGRTAFNILQSQLSEDRFFNFKLCKVGQRSPILGWALNPETINHIVSQISDCENDAEFIRFVRAVDNVCPQCRTNFQ